MAKIKTDSNSERWTQKTTLRSVARDVLNVVTFGLWSRVGQLGDHATRTIRRLDEHDNQLDEHDNQVAKSMSRSAAISSDLDAIRDRIAADELGLARQIEQLEQLSQWRDRLPELAKQIADPIVTQIHEAEARLERAEWGREALVERMNFGDARHEALVHRIQELDEELTSLKTRNTALTALAWDAIAITRRLGAIEDRIEQILERTESEGQPGIVAYPTANKAAS